MGLIELIVIFAVVGFVLWLVLQYVPMPPPMKQTLVVIVVVVLVLFVVRLLFGDIQIPKVR